VLGDFSRSIASTEVLRDNVRRLHEAGIVILIGTDSPVAAVIPGFSFHEELAFLASAGIPAETLVRRATVGGAHLISDKPDFGSLVVGARADVLVVTGDPMLDIGALLEIEHLFAAGERVYRVVTP
jgi:imidazolonepropionase-like amidohydrolase